jgi:hypothetical protein
MRERPEDVRSGYLAFAFEPVEKGVVDAFDVGALKIFDACHILYSFRYQLSASRF